MCCGYWFCDASSLFDVRTGLVLFGDVAVVLCVLNRSRCNEGAAAACVVGVVLQV